MSKPVVALCSGGFDSITLLHDLRYNKPDLEIHTLFFDYGQRSKSEEERCAKHSSEKLNCIFHKVVLPEFNWTHSNFYGEEYKDKTSQYLEYRNLIFFSYALSLAQSIGADKIYAAILVSPLNGGYADNSPEFVSCLNSLSNLQGIDIVTPYITFEKDVLGHLAYKYGVYKGEWFSCDTPKQGENFVLTPCGECPDCKFLKRYDIELENTLLRNLSQGNFNRNTLCKSITETALCTIATPIKGNTYISDIISLAEKEKVSSLCFEVKDEEDVQKISTIARGVGCADFYTISMNPELLASEECNTILISLDCTEPKEIFKKLSRLVCYNGYSNIIIKIAENLTQRQVWEVIDYLDIYARDCNSALDLMRVEMPYDSILYDCPNSLKVQHDLKLGYAITTLNSNLVIHTCLPYCECTDVVRIDTKGRVFSKNNIQIGELSNFADCVIKVKHQSSMELSLSSDFNDKFKIFIE